MGSDRTMLGIGLGVFAYSLFALHDASNKWLVATLPVWQVLFFRSVTIVIGAVAVGRTALLSRALETQLKGPLLFRGVITLAAWLCYYTAARSMPLAQLLTLYFSAPIMTTLLAIPLLGERVTAARWISVILGFLGVLIASDPFGVRASLATALVLIAAAFWGYAIILMRQIARRESSLLQMFYQNLCFLVVTGTLTAFSWVPPTTGELVLLLAVGVLGGLGQFSLFEGARFAPASVMGTVEYSSLLWAFVLGYVIWGDIPSLPVFAGAATILAAGIFLVVMERRAVRS
ncbi:DMT family transporter [Limobrevibacterium gyesilva]|uniref:DMT family transporter n=1 Tax=Limobrevibacterium gyesilva TaxID=2991712 RepID=A0AA41YJ31_9PROT|nr:DMT family transporter [Limobrevibacterium gyesilva]MCW3473460.1 DMT family transporter [Limobrevibacterium gyesilva]